MPEEQPDQLEEQQTPTPAQPQAAIPVEALSGALVDAYRQITAAQPRNNVVQNPLDAMSDAEKQRLAEDALTDPLGVARRVMEMGSRATEQRLRQEALPLIQTSANTIVELYKTRKQRSDPYFAKVEPLFDKYMVGLDITPLVNMNEATRNNELDMRWKMARADVLELEMKKAKPDPLLTTQGGSPGDPPRITDDPWIANMARTYKLTEAQIKELEALNG